MKIPDCFHTLEQGTNMDNEDLLKKRFKELAERAYQSGCYTFTGFLGLSEIALFHKIAAEVSHVGYTLYGGSPDCERRMIAFGRESDMGYPVSYPVCLLKITPRAEKYADELNHRDFLGALLNLGVERSVLGDIVVKSPVAYVYCLDTIRDFLIKELRMVKHTPVNCEETDIDLSDIAPKMESFHLIVASNRADAIVAGLTHLSRSKALELFHAGRIFNNGKELLFGAALLKTGDVLVIRGTGKFRIGEFGGKTRKDRLPITVERYT